MPMDPLGQIKMCLPSHVKKKSRFGWSALMLSFFLKLSVKPKKNIPESAILRVTQYFYLLCSQFLQKASG